jgi:hypothetical protein
MTQLKFKKSLFFAKPGEPKEKKPKEVKPKADRRRKAKVDKSVEGSVSCYKCPLHLYAADNPIAHVVGQGNPRALDVILFPAPNDTVYKSGNMADDYVVKEFVKAINVYAEQYNDPPAIVIEPDERGVNVIKSTMFYLTYYVKCCTGSGKVDSQVCRCCRTVLDVEFHDKRVRSMLLLSATLVAAAYGSGLLTTKSDDALVQNGVMIFANYDPSILRHPENAFVEHFKRKLFKWYVFARSKAFIQTSLFNDENT